MYISVQQIVYIYTAKYHGKGCALILRYAFDFEFGNNVSSILVLQNVAAYGLVPTTGQGRDRSVHIVANACARHAKPSRDGGEQCVARLLLGRQCRFSLDAQVKDCVVMNLFLSAFLPVLLLCVWCQHHRSDALRAFHRIDRVKVHPPPSFCTCARALGIYFWCRRKKEGRRRAT